MKNRIFKYIVKPDSFKTVIPEGAQFLSVDVQNGTPHMWFLTKPNGPFEDRFFRVVATGEEFDASEYKYLGTFHALPEGFVFHLFERVG